jgi:hypothetical protein
MIKIDIQAVIGKTNKSIELYDIPEGTYNVHIELSPVKEKNTNFTGRQPGFGKGLVTYMDKDFNAQLDDFQDYM